MNLKSKFLTVHCLVPNKHGIINYNIIKTMFCILISVNLYLITDQNGLPYEDRIYSQPFRLTYSNLECFH